ncbi:MAG: biopolymer transporter ExbD [Bacteroidaceae bacterium]|nr:biopolymer transporter ExbD [Bacteroidaceae bacterium]
MSKFGKGDKKEMPALNTSSLPDLIFTILFFFMIVTTMREVTLMVEFTVPRGTELEKMTKKSLISYIYVGKPTKELRGKMGSGTQIQLNDKFASLAEVQDYVYQEREAMKESDKPFMKVSLKVDENTQMGIVTDIKQELRKSWALNINYSANSRD